MSASLYASVCSSVYASDSANVSGSGSVSNNPSASVACAHRLYACLSLSVYISENASMYCRVCSSVYAVASRPRFSRYWQARTPRLVWASWRETQLGRNQLDEHSWTGTSYSHETGS